MKILISVILPIYNTPEKWLRPSIESILNQSFADFELILINDSPSNDEVRKFLHVYKKQDQRIRLLENPTNLGVAVSLNKGIEAAKGEFIARMDADDVALPHRLAYQYNYLKTHPTVTLCAAQAVQVDKQGNIIGQTHNPLDYSLICRVLPYQNPTTHPTWMWRNTNLSTTELYNVLPHGEDYDLLVRLIQKGHQVVNLSENVLHYRVHDKNESFGKFFEQKICLQYIQEFIVTKSNRAFDSTHLQEYISIHSQHPENQQSYLYDAKLSSNRLNRLWYILRAFLNSKIERNYLLNLLKAKVIKLLY